MGGGFMENIFDCNEGKMQIFPTLCKNFILAQILALGFGLASGFGQISNSRQQINQVKRKFIECGTILYNCFLAGWGCKNDAYFWCLGCREIIFYIENVA